MWVRFPPGALDEFGSRISDWGLRRRRRAAAVFQSSIANPKSAIPRGSFFQRPGYQRVNLVIRVRSPYEPLTTWPVRLTVQDGRFSTCKWGFDSPTGHSATGPAR